MAPKRCRAWAGALAVAVATGERARDRSWMATPSCWTTRVRRVCASQTQPAHALLRVDGHGRALADAQLHHAVVVQELGVPGVRELEQPGGAARRREELFVVGVLGDIYNIYCYMCILYNIRLCYMYVYIYIYILPLSLLLLLLLLCRLLVLILTVTLLLVVLLVLLLLVVIATTPHNKILPGLVHAPQC